MFVAWMLFYNASVIFAAPSPFFQEAKKLKISHRFYKDPQLTTQNSQTA